MSIPFNLSPLGLVGTGILPVGYMEAEFLESTGNMRIDTGVLPENSVGLYARAGVTKIFDGYVAGVQDRTLSPVQNMGLGRYIPGHYIAPMWANGTVDFISIPSDAPFGFFETELNFLNSRKARLTAPGLNWESVGLLKDFEFTTQKAITLGRKNGLDGYPWQGQICCVKISNGEEIICDFVPVIDKRGVPCMFDRVSKQPFYNSITGSCIVGMGMKQARKLSKLPASGGELTVSLPWEAQLVQHNGQVEQALETARGKGWLLKVQYRDPETDSAVYNKYAACTTTAEVAAVNADYKNDLTAEGEWIYPLPKFKKATLSMFKNKQIKAFLVDLPLLEDGYFLLHETGLERYDGDLSSLISGEGLFHNCFSFKLFNGVLKVLKNGNHMFNSTKMTSFGADLSVLERGEYMFHMVPLTEFLSELPKLSMADVMFSRSLFDKDSTLRIFNSLPTWASGTHKLTIGIHIDHQTDDEVLAAIANAEAKGWTLTVAWRGTPTAQAASTFGLRRPTIYAKCGNMELPDGTSERVLDWGHYVTKWEENGYLEFASVEEAEEYFGIEKETV